MSRTFTKLLLALSVLVAPCLAQTVINPTTQVNWPLVTITGTDTPIQVCNSGNYGQPFQRVDVTPNKTGSCGSDGWQYRGSGGGGSAGITIGSTHVADGGTITNAPGFNSATATAFAATPTPCQNGQYQYGSDASGDALCTALPAQPGQQYIGPQVLSGCGVQYVSGLTYTVGACAYTINGHTYNSPLSNITLPTADPTYPEIDVIYVDTTQTVQYIQGTQAVTPQEPTLNAATQLGLTFVLVPAASTTPGNTIVDSIYLNNTGWPYGVLNNVNGASTNNPYSGLYDVEFGFGGPAFVGSPPDPAHSSYIEFNVPSSGTVTLGNFNNLIFYIRNKAVWPSSCALVMEWLVSGIPVQGSVAVLLNDGQFGFDTTNVSSYQQVSIQTGAFQANSPANGLIFYLSGDTSCSYAGFYLDAVSLQGGVGNNPPSSTLMNYKGVYAPTTAYNQNDVVTSSGGVTYIALGANTNVPLSTTTTWQVVGGNTASAALTTNVLPKATGPHALGDSLFSDDGTNGAYTGTGGFTAPNFKTNGPTNGFYDFTSVGTPNSAPVTNSARIAAPDTVTTPYEMKLPPTPPPDGTHTYFTCTFANPSVCNWSTGGSGMVYPAAGIGNSTGSAWGASYSGSNQIPFSFLNISASNLNTLIQGLTGCNTATYVYTPQSSNCAAPILGSGVQYGAPQSHVFTGDSLAFVQNADTSGGTLSASSCNGTTCQWNDTVPGWYWVGKWITFPSATYGFSSGQWGCLGDVFTQVQSIVGNVITVNEAQGLYPGRTGCTGVQASLAPLSVVQNESDVYPTFAMSLPYYTNGGTITPTVYPRNWPSVLLSDLNTNFATYFSDIYPTTTSIPTDFFIFSDDLTVSTATYISEMQSVLGKAHTAGFYPVIVSTLPEGPQAGSTGNFYAVNDAIRAMTCSPHDTTGGQCADRVIDMYGLGVNQEKNATWVQQGALTPHLTSAGGHRLGMLLANSMASKADFSDVSVAGYGQNQFTEAQIYAGANASLSYVPTTPVNVVTLDMNGANPWYHSYYSFNTLNSVPGVVFNKGAYLGFTNNADGPGAQASSFPTEYLSQSLVDGNAVSVGQNSTSPTVGDNNGGLDLGNGRVYVQKMTFLNGFSSDQTCNAGNYFMYSQSTALTVKLCKNGTTLDLGASITNAAFQWGTSTSTTRAATAADLPVLNYVADSGTTNVYVATLSAVPSGYVNGMTLTIKPGSTNSTTTPTLNVNSLGAVTITKQGSAALAAGDIVSGTDATFIYDSGGPRFQLQNPQTGAVTALNATLPIVVTPSGSTYNVACPTCSVSSGGTTLSLPGAPSLGSVTFNGNVGLLCADTSGSGTAQTCTTSPSITPATGTCFTYITTTANSGTGLTLNIDSFGAKSVAVSSSTGWTTTLVASSSIAANKPMLMCYDGTNLNASGTGFVASGGYPAPVTLTASSSAELDFTTCVTSSFRDYQIRFSDLIPASTSQNVFVQVSTNGGSTYDTTSGHYTVGYTTLGLNQSSAFAGNTGPISTTGFDIFGFGSTTPGTISGTLTIFNLSASTTSKRATLLLDSDGSPESLVVYGGELYTQTAAVNAIRVIAGSGNLASGSVTCQPLPQ